MTQVPDENPFEPQPRKLRVGILGAGTIGKRLADAVALQPDMDVAGLAIHRALPFAHAVQHRFPLYASESGGSFADLTMAGDMEAFLAACDVVADCGPRGTAAARGRLYGARGLPYVVQGGEAADTVEVSYCGSINPRAAHGARSVRVMSCNTTALTRFVAALKGVAEIGTLRLVLVRCTTDPDKAAKGDPAGLTADRGYSHHAEDLRLFWPDLDVRSLGIKAPTNRGHLISGFLRFDADVTLPEIRAGLAAAPRIRLSAGTPGTANLRDRFGGGIRRDCHDAIVWSDALALSGRELAFTLSVHMESIVIPDTIDALRHIGGRGGPWNAVGAITDDALDIAREPAPCL